MLFYIEYKLFKMMYKNVETNIAGDDFIKLQEGKWEIGILEDNPGLDDINNNNFYKDNRDDNKKSNKKRILKNKVNVKLIDGKTKYAHIIHWNLNGPDAKFFCIDNNIFWNKFEE